MKVDKETLQALSKFATDCKNFTAQDVIDRLDGVPSIGIAAGVLQGRREAGAELEAWLRSKQLWRNP